MTQQSIDRVNAAKPLMLAGLPIWRAAIAVGWASPQLQIAFKKLEGVTPGQWLHSLPKRESRRAYRRTLEQSDNYSIARASQRHSSRAWLCSECGHDYADKPSRCPKCGSGQFELGRIAPLAPLAPAGTEVANAR